MMGRTMLVHDYLHSDLFPALDHRDFGKNGIKARSAPLTLRAEFFLYPRSLNDRPRDFKFFHGSTTQIEGEP